MADFSHLRRLPLSSYSKAIELGHELTDHYFEDVIGRIEPPLFDEARTKALLAELCWFAPKIHRGRPPKGCRREELASAVAAIKRDDVPPLILNAIVERLAQPPAKNRLQDPRRAYRERQKTTRNDLIYSVYYELLEALTTGVGPSFPALAELVDTARTPSIPHEEAMRLTQVFLSDQLKLRPPGIDRMRNIISEKSRLYRDVFGMK